MSVEISVMIYGHPLWDKTISFAENCSWKAGPYLAKMMRNKEFSETERVINAASDYARSIGYEKIYIMSGEQGLYEKYGFVKIGDFKTVYGTEDQLFQKTL